jgi:hypothetical protein
MAVMTLEGFLASEEEARVAVVERNMAVGFPDATEGVVGLHDEGRCWRLEGKEDGTDGSHGPYAAAEADD